MFLTAVLQGHTDSLSRTDDDEATATSQVEETSATLDRLEEALTAPVHERVQPLPSVHRSRWV